MAEMANTLAFSAYSQLSTICNSTSTASPTYQILHKQEANTKDRDSGVFLSDDEDPLLTTTPSRQSSISQKLAPSTRTSLIRTDSSHIARLRRPRELDISCPTIEDEAKPKSELELQFDLVRNSQTRSNSGLKSPTQLLNDRLNLYPKKKTPDPMRRFKPPRPMLNDCILPSPAAKMEAFTRRDVCARTENGMPAWWCKFDGLVVLDGAVEDEDGNIVTRTRSSKGLRIARRRGVLETIVIPLGCSHCREMLHRSEWKYDVLVCERSVCWDCRERCRWQIELDSDQAEGKRGAQSNETNVETQYERPRERADSVVQNQQGQEELLMRIIGVAPESRIKAVRGIEERLEEAAEVGT